MVGVFTSSDAAVIIAAIVGGIVTAVLGIVALGIPMWQQVRRGRDAVNEARANAVEAKHAATAVAVQMRPNGGSSLRDALDDVRATVARLESGQASIGALADRLAVTADRVDARTLVLDQRLTAIEQRTHN